MQLTVRPLADADVEAAREVQTRAFEALDRTLHLDIQPVTAEAVARQRARMRHFMTHDGDGSWVVEADDGTLIGVALALHRGDLWGLSLLVVDPTAQSAGAGRALIAAALRHGGGGRRGVILSSPDPRAMRVYASAGFDLHPQVAAQGELDRALLPRADHHVREAGPDDAEFADAVDLAVRGAPRGPDHAMLAAYGRMWVYDDGHRRGYAYTRGSWVATVAATDEGAATALLWRALADCEDGERHVNHVTANQQWAVRVALAARLRLQPWGPVFWRGGAPPPAYLPDGAYL